MANTPKKVKDPTEAALSAIQDALAVRDVGVEPEPANPPPGAPVTSADGEEMMSDPPWRVARPASDDEMSYDQELRRPEDQGLLRRPANDDRESIGQILR